MNIFFTASPRAKKEFGDNFAAIYDAIKVLNCKNVSDFIIKVDPKKFYNADSETVLSHYKESVKNVNLADLVVLEVSLQNLSMGYSAYLAINAGKPVIALHVMGHKPHILSNIDNDKLQVVEYNLDNIESVLRRSIDYAADQMDSRFNFFVSPKHQHYLDWIARARMTPRAVHLRRLLEEDMDSNKDYQIETGLKKTKNK